MKRFLLLPYSVLAFFVLMLFAGNYQAKAQLNASFTFSPAAGCAPVLVNFKSASTGTIAKYTWRFGNGNTSSFQNPGATYDKPGTYSVTLTVFDSKGDSSTITKANAISIYGAPSPNFTVSDSDFCTPKQVTFTDKTKTGAQISKWEWDFGDGSTSNSQDPSHTYTSYGKFTVTLVITDIYGCTGSLSKSDNIVIGSSAQVSFSADNQFACIVPATVDFSSNVSNASGSIGYSWNFGDGNTSTAVNPSHSYTAFGKYSVSLTITDKTGCPVTAKIPNYITIQKIAAGFSASETKGCVPASVNFTPVSASVCPSCLNYWNFGDGTTSSSADATSHIYTTMGTYTVSQKVLSIGQGCDDSTTKISYITVNPVPKDSFHATNRVACKAPLTVNFSGWDSAATSFKWNFGDGSTNSGSLNLKHTYTSTGNFTVSLTATNSYGCIAVYSTSSIHITQPIPYITTIKGNLGCLPDTVQFSGTFPSGYAPGNKWLWDFGDSTPTSSDSTPLHVYTKVGQYTVTLTMWNSAGCSGMTTFPLSAGRKPYATFKAYPIKACVGTNVDFQLFPNIDSVQATNYLFNFGDGVTGSVAGGDTSTSHAYAIPGVYTVSLTAFDYACGDSVSIKKYITVEPPSAGFVYLNSSCNPKIISFYDSSIGATSIYWDFGDGYTSSVKDPVHRYKNAGTYTVTQTVSNNKTMCTQSSAQSVTIDSGGADFSTTVSGNCHSTSFTFSAILAPGQDSSTFSFSWNYGDGKTGNKKTVHHTFADTGHYPVRLITNDNQGCIDTVVQVIPVDNKALLALFTASQNLIICPPQTISFIDTSVSYGSPIVSWEWYFSDGSTSSDENPQKIFNYPGNYNVALAIVSAAGCTDSIMKKDFIIVKGAHGTYSSNVNKGCDSVTVTFTVNNTNADTFTWDMTDGAILYGPRVTHTFYDTKQDWVPTLFLTDSAGCKYPLYPKDTIFIYPNPVAAFTYDTSCNGHPTVFIDQSTVSSGSDTGWAWDFGDGSNGSGADPVHIYAQSNAYNVALTATTNHGCSNTVNDIVNVKELIPGFTAVATKVCLYDSVRFFDATQYDIPVTSRLWNFGDGNTSTLLNPVHKYTFPGFYTITEIESNRLSCLDTVTKTNYVSIGDTLTPPPLQIRYITVLTNTQIGVYYHAFNNPSFAEYLILRQNPVTFNFDQIGVDTNITDSVFYDKNVDASNNFYCYKVLVETSCNKITDQYLTQEHCSIKLSTTSQINAVSLNWTPYIGWGGVSSYYVLRSKQADSANYHQIASLAGTQLQYYDSEAICAGRYHYLITATSPILNDSNSSQNVPYNSSSNISVGIPIHVNNVPAVNLIRATVVNNSKALVQ